MTKVKTQHYVPRFYLENFTNSENKICVFDKATDKTFQTTIENIACENYFYDSDQVDLKFNKVQYLEKYYSTIESTFAPFYKDFILSLASNKKRELTFDDRKIFSKYFVSQIDRTKEHRETSRQSYSVIKKELISKGFTKQQLIELGFEVDNPDPKDLHLESILLGNEMIDTFSEILESHIWIIVENNTSEPFFTSDNPIAKIANIKNDYISYDGYASEGIEIIFPLNSKYLLVLKERGFFKKFEGLDNKILMINNIENVNYYNSLETIRSYRQVYASIDNFKTIPDLKKINPDAFKMDRTRIK